MGLRGPNGEVVLYVKRARVCLANPASTKTTCRPWSSARRVGASLPPGLVPSGGGRATGDQTEVSLFIKCPGVCPANPAAPNNVCHPLSSARRVSASLILFCSARRCWGCRESNGGVAPFIKRPAPNTACRLWLSDKRVNAFLILIFIGPPFP